MPGTKYFCIALGCVLLLATFIPAPYPLLLETTAAFAGQVEAHGLIKDGSITVNRDVIITKHAEASVNLRGTDVSQADADAAAVSLVHHAVRRAVSPLGLVTWIAMFAMGIAWIVVGIRIPSRIPGLASATNP